MGDLSCVFEKDRDFIMIEFALSECRRALKALQRVEEASLPKPNPRHTGCEVYEIEPVFDSIRLALQLSSNVSKMLWPPRNKARGVHLRALARIAVEHPLRDRTLRNHVEHIDERLDAWTAISPRPFIAVETIIPPTYPKDAAGPKMEDLAAIVYDQGTKRVHLFGDSFSLIDLANSLQDVGIHLNAALLSMQITR